MKIAFIILLTLLASLTSRRTPIGVRTFSYHSFAPINNLCNDDGGAYCAFSNGKELKEFITDKCPKGIRNTPKMSSSLSSYSSTNNQDLNVDEADTIKTDG
eukprot:GHVR01125067.1.p1 GENE.GHVR01125067.1~~GHVR01125067.1.p1  ORF type:complete len:101 (+),score=2.33 GHVR01125067.1:536-838(+)